MEKEIYIITNDINHKVYISQAVSAAEDWAEHLENVKTQARWSVIDQVMAKLGVEHFSYKVIEKTNDPNSREKYWIWQYGSVMPRGYNCYAGAVLVSSQVESIINDLLYGWQPLAEIARKNYVETRSINRINKGITHRMSNLTYPLRDPNRKIPSQEIIEQIQRELFSNENTFRELAAKYHYSIETIRNINMGRLGGNDQYKYPIRNRMSSYFSAADVEKITEMLQTSPLKIAEIAKLYGVSSSLIRNINIGRTWFRKNVHYPIRKEL